MAAVELNLRPDARTLRQFGWITLVGFGALAVCAHTESLMFSGGLGSARSAVALSLAGVAAISAGFSLVAPRANLPLYLGLTVATYPIGFVLSYVIMGVLFFGLFAPLGVAFRAFGRDSMHREITPEAESYWAHARAERRTRESYFKQF